MAVAQPSALFDEVLDFLATAPSAEQMIAFQPSQTLQARASYLLEQNRHDLLTPEERVELDEFTRMNHFMNMLRIKARQNS